jgi:hypothetical protein
MQIKIKKSLFIFVPCLSIVISGCNASSTQTFEKIPDSVHGIVIEKTFPFDKTKASESLKLNDVQTQSLIKEINRVASNTIPPDASINCATATKDLVHYLIRIPEGKDTRALKVAPECHLVTDRSTKVRIGYGDEPLLNNLQQFFK